MIDNTTYLKDIIENANLALEFVKGMKFEQFERDIKTSYACARSIEIIGEASKKLEDSIKANYPEIPCKKVAGMRDIMIHNYSGVNTRKVWETVQNEIPQLLKCLEKKI